MGKKITVHAGDTIYDRTTAEGLEGRLLAREIATESAPPRTPNEMADRAAEIYQLDALILAKAEEIKGLKKTREDLAQSLLRGCAAANQTNLLDGLEEQA